MQKSLFALTALAGALAALPAHATNGYFTHGYGIKSQGMGGVGIALPQDALAAAANPAGMALVGDRADVGITWFRPQREATLSNTAFGFSDGSFDGNGRDDFLIPEAGFTKHVSEDLALGVSIYGNGGMNTSYDGGIPLLNGGSGRSSGIDYMQAFVAPTVAWKANDTHTFGAALILAYQRFEARGIDNFTGISVDNNKVTGNGHDSAFGAGLHLGWIGKITDRLSLGARYQTRTYFQDFDDYEGLFAGGGNMDTPSNYGIGFAFQATPELTLAADVLRIRFSETDAIGNSASRWNGQFGGAGNLGRSSGPGFGWEDSTVYKLGVSYQYSPQLTLRAGYDHIEQPIPGKEALFNVLAPGLVKDHVTLGATWVLRDGGELSFAYMHAFEEKVRGRNAIPPQFGGGDVELEMYQDSLGIAYGRKF